MSETMAARDPSLELRHEQDDFDEDDFDDGSDFVAALWSGQLCAPCSGQVHSWAASALDIPAHNTTGVTAKMLA